MRGFPGCVHREFSAEEADDRVSIRIYQYRTRPDLALWLQHRLPHWQSQDGFGGREADFYVSVRPRL